MIGTLSGLYRDQVGVKSREYRECYPSEGYHSLKIVRFYRNLAKGLRMSEKSITFAAAKVGDKVCHFGSYDAYGTTFDNDEMSGASEHSDKSRSMMLQRSLMM